MKNIPIRQINPAHSDIIATEIFTIRSIEHVMGGKDMFHELHRHDYYFILAVEKAKGKHEIDFQSYDVKDFALFFIRPGQVHQLELKAGTTGYLIEFNPQFYYPSDIAAKQLLRKASTKNICQLDSLRMKRILPVLDYILQEFNQKQEGYNDVIKANIGIFLIEYIRNCHNSVKSINEGTNYSQERVDQLLELLETNIATHKQASQYAEMLNLSLYQLNAITKSTLGKTCSDLITEHIILESKRYLLATSNQVNQIAYELGYEDVSYFIRFFKKQTGYTPDAFRQNFK